MNQSHDDSADHSPRLRAADDDRAVVAAHLQDAFSRGQVSLEEFEKRVELAYAAQFRDELAALTSDLPQSSTTSPPQAPHPQVTGETGGVARSLGLLGTTAFNDDWLVAQKHTSLALVGTNEINLSQARLPARDITVTAYSVLGSIEVRVPEDFRVRSEGRSLLGTFSLSDAAGVTLRQSELPADAPVVRVRGWSLLGTVAVVRVPRE